VCWFPRLVLDQRSSESKFGSRSALFIFYAFILLMVNRNAYSGLF
jgi:hypothetical protein